MFSIVASSIRKVPVCAVTGAGMSRMNDANNANTNLRSIGLPPFACLTVTPERRSPPSVDDNSSSVLRERAGQQRVAPHKGIVLSFRTRGHVWQWAAAYPPIASVQSGG